METLYIDKPDETMVRIAESVGYRGRRFQLQVTSKVTLHSRYWNSGHRSTWTLHRLADGVQVSLAAMRGFSDPPQFGGLSSDPELEIPAGAVLVENHSGAYCHLTFYLRPDDATPLLSERPDLSEHEAIVLIATASLKASYDGKKPRRIAAARHGIDDAQFDAVSAALKARKLLNGAGAITAAGRNAVSNHPLRNRMH